MAISGMSSSSDDCMFWTRVVVDVGGFGSCVILCGGLFCIVIVVCVVGVGNCVFMLVGEDSIVLGDDVVDSVVIGVDSVVHCGVAKSTIRGGLGIVQIVCWFVLGARHQSTHCCQSWDCCEVCALI